MLPSAPGQSATVLVALATIGGIPSPTRAGKVSSVPPPAIELTAPATAEARTTSGRRSAAERSRAGSGVSTPNNSPAGLAPCRFRASSWRAWHDEDGDDDRARGQGRGVDQRYRHPRHSGFAHRKELLRPDPRAGHRG